MAEIIRRAFIDEDEPMIRAVEDVMDGREFFSMRPVILETDASGIMARRMLAKMIREEQQAGRSEEHTSELQSLMRISYAVFCLKKKKTYQIKNKQYTSVRQREQQ